MFIEHLERLRCTRPHADTWLVTAFDERVDRFIRTGTLGCPICGRRYPIVDGVAYFDVAPSPLREHEAQNPSPDDAIRAAAFLAATERATLVLGGEWALSAPAVTALVPLLAFALNPAGAVQESEYVSVLRSSERIPLAHGSVHGIALDAATATDSMLASAIEMLRPGGRIVAPVEVAVPPEVKELARDTAYWVGETVGAFVPLRRADR